MASKNLKKQHIHEGLSQISDTWQLEEKYVDLQSFSSLCYYLVKLKQKNPVLSFISKPEPLQIPYNVSLFHFFIYYTYYPKYPFVTYVEDTLIFGAFTGRHYNKIDFSFPIFSNATTALNHLNHLLSIPVFNSLLKDNNVRRILIRDVSDNFVNSLRDDDKKYKFKLESLRELNYATYDVNRTLDSTGIKFSSLRWHLNSFKKANHKIEVVSLNDSVKAVSHLIGQWRRKALKDRGFSYVNVRSDMLSVKLFGNTKKNIDIQDKCEIVCPESVISRVLKIDGVIAAFNLGYPLGIFKKQDVFAHAIGISDISIPHLAEYAQYDFWKQIHKAGFSYINDGPTWRDDLEIYKDKFRPIEKKRYYWATLILRL